MPKLTLNGKEVEFNPGETILQVAWREGVKIPVFCYHPKLEPEASCRVCLVEVELKGRRGLLPACATKAAEGMVVETETPQVREKVRARTLEFLLANHPLECPVCDAGGECDLQNLTYLYGDPVHRYDFPRRLKPKFDIGPLLRFYPNRCVMCTRCVRLYRDVLGGKDWERFERGWEIMVGPGRDKVLESEFSGNLADVCPLGAITQADYAFSSRPWENEEVPAVSPEDSMGVPVWVVVRKRGPEVRGVPSESGKREELHRVLKITARDDWISDRDRYSHQYLNTGRLTQALARKEGRLVKLPVEEAAKLFARTLRNAWRAGPQRVAVLSGARASNEAAFLARKLFKDVLGIRATDFRPPKASVTPDPVEEVLGQAASSASLEDLASADLILVFGFEIKEKFPTLGLKVMEAVRRGAKLVLVSPWRDKYAEKWASQFIQYHPAEEALVARRLLAGVANATGYQVKGLSEEPLDVGLAEAKRPVIVFPDDLDPEAAKALASIVAILKGTKHLYLRARPNGQGFWDAGFRPDEGFGTADTLERALRGELELLVLWDVDPLLEWPEREKWEEALRKVPLVFYLGSFGEDPAVAFADLAIPLALPYECRGSRTSSDGRVLWSDAALAPPGDAITPCQLFRLALEELGEEIPQMPDALRELPGYKDVLLPPPETEEPYPPELASLRKFRRRPLYSRVKREFKPRDVEFKPLKVEKTQLTLVLAENFYKSSYYAFRNSITKGFWEPGSVELHPRTAASLGVAEGEALGLEVFGEAHQFTVRVSERTPEGVIRYEGLFVDSSVNSRLPREGWAPVKALKEAGT